MASRGNIPFLPFEIIINILERLPVKPILRFQSVCKNFKNLLKTPDFITEHLNHSAHKNPILLIHEYDYEGTPPSLRLLNKKMETVEVLSTPSTDCFKQGWKIIDSCNGLLCVKVNLDRGTFPRSLFLWNPTIREIREIPLTATKDYLLCNFGLGYSSIINDFKIVRFCNLELRENEERKYFYAGLFGLYRAEVYSLSTGSWKELESGALLKNTRIISKPVNYDGTIVWLGVRDSSPVAVYFNVAEEVFTLALVPIPPVLGLGFRTTFGVYKNKFAVFQISCEFSFNCVHIWVMEEVSSESGKSFSCIEEYTIDIFSYLFHPLCIWRNEIVLLDQECEDDVEDKPKNLVKLFNVTTKKWKEFFNFSSTYDYCAGFNYERSLHSVWK